MASIQITTIRTTKTTRNGNVRHTLSVKVGEEASTWTATTTKRGPWKATLTRLTNFAAIPHDTGSAFGQLVAAHLNA